jgi:putative transposase
VEVEIPDPVCRGEAIGIDLGLAHYAALSDGTTLPNPRNLIWSEKKLARLQRRLCRRKKGSAGWRKARVQVSGLQEKIANQRKDFQHKLTRWLVDEFGVIGLESLNFKGMLHNRRLAKQIADASWGELCRQLAYKGEWYGCQIRQIDQWSPSSKTCSVCGAVMGEMRLSVRDWVCPECQAHHDRDVNAARNILIQATVGTTERRNIDVANAGEVHVRPLFFEEAGTQKPEANYFSGSSPGSIRRGRKLID